MSKIKTTTGYSPTQPTLPPTYPNPDHDHAPPHKPERGHDATYTYSSHGRAKTITSHRSHPRCRQHGREAPLVPVDALAVRVHLQERGLLLRRSLALGRVCRAVQHSRSDLVGRWLVELAAARKAVAAREKNCVGRGGGYTHVFQALVARAMIGGASERQARSETTRPQKYHSRELRNILWRFGCSELPRVPGLPANPTPAGGL